MSTSSPLGLKALLRDKRLWRQKRLWAFLGGCLLAFLAVLLLTNRLGAPDQKLSQGSGRYGQQGGGLALQPVIVSERLFQEKPVIYGGIYVDEVYELNLGSRTFTADGYFWLEWPDAIQDLMDLNGTTPKDLVVMTNRIELWDSTFDVATPESLELSSGRHYQLYQFSSRFYDDTISFKRDPFDILSLPISIELKQPYMSNKYADVRLIPQVNPGRLVGQSGNLSGYELESASWKGFLHRYQTRFGSWYAPAMAVLRLEIFYRADIWTGLINWVLPLIIVDSIVLMAPSVEGSLGDVRLAIPSTALLTLIFLQQSYHSFLPRLPYTTFLDDLFSCSYLISMALFALFTWGHNAYATADEDSKSHVMATINRADRTFQILSVISFGFVACLSWSLR